MSGVEGFGKSASLKSRYISYIVKLYGPRDPVWCGVVYPKPLPDAPVSHVFTINIDRFPNYFTGTFSSKFAINTKYKCISNHTVTVLPHYFMKY